MPRTLSFDLDMTTAIIISAILFVIGFIVMMSAVLRNWEDWIFDVGTITMIASFAAMILLAVFHTGEIKKVPKEYPASEYTFKIKVVEFEEQRDTILVVIPKEK